MARRGRGRNRKREAGDVTDPTVFQLKLDYTPEQAMEVLFEAGALSARIEALDKAALDTRREQRKLKAALAEILKQASERKRAETVEVVERVDLEHGIVHICRKDDPSVEISFRHMTSEEKKSGVVLNPAQAAEALRHVAEAAGDVPAAPEEDEAAVPPELLPFVPLSEQAEANA